MKSEVHQRRWVLLDELIDRIFDDAAHIKKVKMNSDAQHASLAHDLQS